jgi:hypothetical protein
MDLFPVASRKKLEGKPTATGDLVSNVPRSPVSLVFIDQCGLFIEKKPGIREM